MIILFVKQASIFLVLLFIINFSLFFLIRGFYIRDYNEVDLGYSEYLLADSHGTPLGDFTELHDVHNFSSQSDSYLDMERKLRFLIQNTTVKKIYISVDDHTLSSTREKQNNLDRSSYYTQKEDFANYKEYIYEKYLKYYCVFLNDRYSLVIKNFIQNELFNVSKWGGVRSKSSWEDLTSSEQIEKSLDRVHYYFEYSFPSVKMTDSLKRIVAICKENNIELIGLKFPLSKTYVAILENESYHANSLLINNGLLIADFDSLFLEEDHLFRDMDHLDKAGGEKFVEILFNSLK
jgi:hypothetical protein